MLRNDLFVLNLSRMFARERPMQVGDRAPNFVLVDQRGGDAQLYTAITGQPIVLLFLAREDAGNAELIARFDRALAAAPEPRAHFFAVCDHTVAEHARLAEERGIELPLLADKDARVRRHFLAGLSATPPVAFVLDANQRVAGIEGDGAAEDFLPRVTQAAERVRPAGEARLIGTMAPALVVPNVLSRDDCRWLIEIWERRGHAEGTVRTRTEAGLVKTVDHGIKRRADHIIEDPETERALGGKLFTRIGPEVYKIYHYDNWTLEKLRIGCYEAGQAGFFSPHRDNYNENVKHRRYALTLNLNSEDYEGGDLRFPEYGNELYRPPTGGAIVFSCSMLHEVVPITRGRRFTLLSFLNPISGT